MSTAPIEAHFDQPLLGEESRPHLRSVPNHENDIVINDLLKFVGNCAIFSYQVAASSEYIGNIKVRDNLLVSIDTDSGEKRVLITSILAGISEETKDKLTEMVQPNNRHFSA